MNGHVPITALKTQGVPVTPDFRATAGSFPSVQLPFPEHHIEETRARVSEPGFLLSLSPRNDSESRSGSVVGRFFVLLQGGIPFRGYSTTCLAVHQFEGVGVVPTLGGF